MESKQDHYMERREGIDRRNWHCEYDFPYVDSHGILVTNDRRDGDERRNIAIAAITYHKRNLSGYIK